MIIKATELIEEFYEIIKDDYPHLDIKNIKEICNKPFEYVAKNIKKGHLAPLRIKYLGNFVVYPMRAKEMFNRNQQLYKEGKIEKELYEKRNEQTLNFFKREGITVPHRKL